MSVMCLATEKLNDQKKVSSRVLALKKIFVPPRLLDAVFDGDSISAHVFAIGWGK